MKVEVYSGEDGNTTLKSFIIFESSDNQQIRSTRTMNMNEDAEIHNGNFVVVPKMFIMRHYRPVQREQSVDMCMHPSR